MFNGQKITILIDSERGKIMENEKERRWVCVEKPEEHKYDEPHDGFCPRCKEMGIDSILCEEVPLLEQPTVDAPPQPPLKGEHGLGIIVLDFSSSMTEDAFLHNHPAKKIELVSKALGSALSKARNMSNADNAYIAIIGFSTNAKLIDVYQASQLNEDPEYWVNFIKDEHENKVILQTSRKPCK